MNPVLAKHISTQGDFLEAVIEVNGVHLHVMDEYGGADYREGDVISVWLSVLTDDDADWETVFSANPHRSSVLMHLDGWSYTALGKVTSVNPMLCDCGGIVLEAPVSSTDERCVGEYLGFKVVRLDAVSA